MKHPQKNLRRVLTLAVVAVMLVGTAVASSAITKRAINVTYRDIKLVVDGVEVVPKDAAGNPLAPFIEDASGSVYLPVRGVGSALGKPVDWDGETSTVYVGSKTKATPYQVNHGTVYEGSDPAKAFSVEGITHTNGVVLESVHSTANESGKAYDGTALWNTKGHENMTFTIGHVGDIQRNATLYVSLDGISFTEYKVAWDTPSQTITVPLSGASNVKLDLVADPTDVSFQFNAPKDYKAEYGIYDIILD